MAKTKKITINEFEKAVEYGPEPDVGVVAFNGLEIEVKRFASYEEVEWIIESVSNACFDENGGFRPEARYVAMRLAILAVYTNLTIPKALDKRYEMACKYGVFETIAEAIDQGQLDMIDMSIRVITDLRARSAINDVVRSANEASYSMKQLVEKMDTQLSSVFDGFTSEDVGNMLKMLSNGSVDEEKIVKAYIEQTKSASDDGGEEDEK